jgi:hypothetical protein
MRALILGMRILPAISRTLLLALGAGVFGTLRADEPAPERVVFTDDAHAKWQVTISVQPTPDAESLVSYPLSLTDDAAAPVDEWWKGSNGLTWDGVDQAMTSSIEPTYHEGVLTAAIDLNWMIWRKSGWWKRKYSGAIRHKYHLRWMHDFEERGRSYTLIVRWTKLGAVGEKRPDVIRPAMSFEDATALLEKHQARPTMIQIDYPDEAQNRRIEHFILRDGRTVEFSMTRKKPGADWTIRAIAEVTWIQPGESREKEWRGIKELILTELGQPAITSHP